VPTPSSQSLAAGDREAFAALYDRLGVRLYRTALTMLASTTEAEDVVHDLFVELARNCHRLAAVADLDGYVFTMLRHAVSRRQRRESLARRSLDRLGRERLDAGGFSASPVELADDARDRVERAARHRAAARQPNLPQNSGRRMSVRRNCARNSPSVNAKPLKLPLSRFAKQCGQTRPLQISAANC
jgi:RNA polymerase sigma-70 factor (ECF subfamily)